MSERPWMRWIVMALVGYGLYLGYVQVQSHLGRQAFEATGLTSYAMDEARELAQAEGKPVLVEMAAVW